MTRLSRLSKCLLALLIFSSVAWAQPPGRKVVTISDFSGGLNRTRSGIDIGPSEAYDLTNMSLDKFGPVHKRYGAVNWNENAIDTTTEIRDVHYLEDRNGSKRLFVANGHYVYEQLGWTDTNSVWTGTEISYSTGYIDSIEYSTKRVYGVNTSWILVAAPGDRLLLHDMYFVVDSVLSDTCIVLNTPEANGSDSTGYEIIKYITGDPWLSSWNGNLYVADSKGEAWWYDGTTPQLLAIVDSGTVDYAFYTDTSTFVYTELNKSIDAGDNYIWANSLPDFDIKFADSTSLDTTSYVVLRLGGDNFNVFKARIKAISPDKRMLRLEKSTYEKDNWNPPLRRNADEIWTFPNDGNVYNGSWSFIKGNSRATYYNRGYIVDYSKCWLQNYTGFYLVSGRKADRGALIAASEMDALYYEWGDTTTLFPTGSRYYIVRQLPSLKYKSVYHPSGRLKYADSLLFEQSYYTQIAFHKNVMWAIGYSLVPRTMNGAISGDTTNTNRVWFSDYGMPSFVPPDQNFDLSGANTSTQNLSLYSQDASSAIFSIGDNLYVITKSGIYRIAGTLDLTDIGYGLAIKRLPVDIGTGEPRSVIVKDGLAYFMNTEGIWGFDGQDVSPISYFAGSSPSQKASHKIKDLVETYRGSRKTAGFFRDEIYFSYPDSHKTIVYFAPKAAFTGPWDFGMSAINSQSVSVDSGYFLFANPEYKGYVFKYPGDLTSFYDNWIPDSIMVYTSKYQTGRMSFGDLYKEKVLEKIDVVMDYPAGTTLNLYPNFSDSAYFTKSDTVSYAKGVVRVQPMIEGDHFRFEITSSVAADFEINAIRYQYYER